MAEDLAAKYPIGSMPRIHYLAYLIFVSYVVSFIGATTTVELLHRRVSGNGWRNWVQLAACSVSFGLVAIWCMHFVGNRAIILGDGEKEIQLYYNPTYTAISAIVPIVVIFLGLVVADRFHKGSKGLLTRYIALLVCGVCSGAAITEMHYLGNNGTTDYHLKPSWGYVIGAACIAIGAATISYTLFFHWSRHWINMWWRRIIVALILALAVSGMHWTAAAGTEYEIRGYHQGSGVARNTNLIIAVCLSLSACSVCFGLGFLKQRHARKLKDRAQQVVLAVATFDSEGRLLVTQGGLLPCQTITRQFHQRTFDEDFNTAHPVFQWIFRVSRNWGGIVDLIPSMREHLHGTGYIQFHSPVMANDSRASMSPDDDTSYSATFRELFCVTAQEIARSLGTRLQDLGTLYEDVLTTGTLLSRMPWSTAHGAKAIVASDVAHGDLESGIANPILFGKGQLLVLSKKVNTDEANRLQNSGYRFASIDQVGDVLARSLQISREDLNSMIGRLQLFCEREPWTPPTGTYLAAFLLQPSPVMKGLDVIIPHLTPDRLPMVKLASTDLSQQQLRVLQLFDGLTLEECFARLDRREGAVSDDDIWLEKFRNKIVDLVRECPDSSLRKAVFSTRQISATHGSSAQTEMSDATIFAFCGIKDVYDRTLQSTTLRHVPLSLFQCYQRTYPHCPDHAIFAQKNHKEFSSLISSRVEAQASSPRSTKKWWPFVRSSSVSENSINPDSSSEKGLFGISQYTSTDSTNLTSSSHPFGGIMVSQNIVINNDDPKSMIELGVRSEAGVADKEKQTMADRLMSITMSLRDPYSQTRGLGDGNGH